MKRLLFFVCLAFCGFILSCSSLNAIGDYQPASRLFRCPEYGCQLRLPADTDWRPAIQRKGKSDLLFEVYSPSKIVYVFLAAESLDNDLEDYFLLLKMSNRIDQRPGYKFFGKTHEIINGEPALRFVYSAEFGDEAFPQSAFTYVNVLFRKNGRNYRLTLYTLSEAYERKKDLMDRVIRGFSFMEEK